jgi:hypothetical protein
MVLLISGSVITMESEARAQERDVWRKGAEIY